MVVLRLAYCTYCGRYSVTGVFWQMAPLKIFQYDISFRYKTKFSLSNALKTEVKLEVFKLRNYWCSILWGGTG